MTDRTTHPAGETPSADRTTGLETELARGRRGETPFLLVRIDDGRSGRRRRRAGGALLLVWWLS